MFLAADIRDRFDSGVDRLAVGLGERDHLISPSGRTANAQTSVTLRDKATRDGMEDLVEHGVADTGGSCVLYQRQCEPLTHNRQMAFAKKPKGRFRHCRHVLGD
jgi:hypothetical protein